MMKNIKNWKWWLVLPLVLPWLFVATIPRIIIYILELSIKLVEHLNFGYRHSHTLDRIIDWVQSDYEYEE